jgi:hypothetical protein
MIRPTFTTVVPDAPADWDPEVVPLLEPPELQDATIIENDTHAAATATLRFFDLMLIGPLSGLRPPFLGRRTGDDFVIQRSFVLLGAYVGVASSRYPQVEAALTPREDFLRGLPRKHRILTSHTAQVLHAAVEVETRKYFEHVVVVTRHCELPFLSVPCHLHGADNWLGIVHGAVRGQATGTVVAGRFGRTRPRQASGRARRALLGCWWAARDPFNLPSPHPTA